MNRTLLAYFASYIIAYRPLKKTELDHLYVDWLGHCPEIGRGPDLNPRDTAFSTVEPSQRASGQR
jgi:hypothetical protein